MPLFLVLLCSRKAHIQKDIHVYEGCPKIKRKSAVNYSLSNSIKIYRRYVVTIDASGCHSR